MEIPSELRSVLEVVEEGGVKHIRCKYRAHAGDVCNTYFINILDAIRHLVTHDERYKRYLLRLNASLR